MKENRESITNSAKHLSVDKLEHETNKAFDESMASLIEWLNLAVRQSFLTHPQALEIFKEELKSRRDHES